MKVVRHTLGRVPKSLPSSPAIRKIVRAVLSSEKKRAHGDINVIFVDDKTIKSLNLRFLSERGTTDVIAFPYPPLKGSPAPFTFGDIYICTGEADRNARRFGEAYERELKRLVIHGMLHLLGYDDHAPKDRKKMWARQEKLLAETGK